MKKRNSQNAANLEDELLPEYDAEFFKTLRPNPYVSRVKQSIVLLDPDVARVFDSSDSVNQFLRSAIEAVTHGVSEKTVRTQKTKRSS
jgi:hypothetical protein